MREETKETFNSVADFEDELRRYAKFVMGTRLQPLAVVFSSLAAHLHDAWKREKAEIEASALDAGGIVEAQRHKGNAAAMRAALEPWIAFAEWLLENAGKDALGVAIRDNGPIIRQRLEELRAALSAPPRNCDEGTAEEQAEKFRNFCKLESSASGGHCTGCRAKCYGRNKCEFVWAQMPYESEVSNG